MPLATRADVEVFTGPIAEADVPLLERLLAEASDAFRAQVGTEVSVVTGDVVEMDNTEGRTVVLPGWPVVAIQSVYVRGRAEPLDPSEYSWSRLGILDGPFPTGFRSVKVTYDHGFEVVPASVVRAIARAVAGRFQELSQSSTVLVTAATVADVLALVPEAELNVPDTASGARELTEADIIGWLEQTAADVSMRAAGWGALPGAAQSDFRASARRLIAHGAAATLERSRFPERSTGPVDGSHAVALQDIYDRGLEALVQFVRDRVPQSNDWVFAQTLLPQRYGGALPW